VGSDALEAILEQLRSAVCDGQVNESLSICLLASAGSGKTYALTSIYTELLFLGADFSSILAITFTNKAANEMKQRVLSSLSQKAFDKGDPSAEELLKEILFDYSMFSIKTIDSFMNSLRLSFAGEIGISPISQLKVSFVEDIDIIIQRLLESSRSNPKIKAAIDEFMAYYVSLPGVYKDWDPVVYLRDFFSSFLRKESDFRANVFFGKVDRDMGIKAIEGKKAALIKAADGCGASFSKNAKNLLDKITEDYLYNAPFDVFKSALWNKSYPEDLSRSVLVKSSSQQQEIVFPYWQDLADAVRRYALVVSVSMGKPFAVLFEAFKRELERYQFENDILYVDLLQKDISSIDSNKLRERFAIRSQQYKFFLLDEFQDTNVSQWHTLSQILEEALSCGGVLFYVGDPKQTIYRWRGSIHNIFERARGLFASAKELNFSLKYNWRSLPQIVEFNNNIFDSVPDVFRLSDEAMEDILKVYADSSQTPRRQGPGEVSIIQLGGEDGEDYESAFLHALKNNNKGDIAILVRRRKEAEGIVSFLLENGFSVISDESLTLAGNCHIKALMSLLGFLAFPYQERYLKGFILSPMWAKITQKGLDYWQEWISVSPKSVISRLKGEHKELFEEFIEKHLNASGFVGIHELVSNILYSFDAFNLFQDSSAFFFEFLELLLSYEKEKAGSLPDFVDWWFYGQESESVSLNMSEDSPDTIKVMTVHSAKGLEFSTVILPILSVDMFGRHMRSLTDNIFWQETEEGIIPYYINNALNVHPLLKAIADEEKKNILWDNINLLYVAMTRAKDRLVLFLPGDMPPNKKDWARWIKERLSI